MEDLICLNCKIIYSRHKSRKSKFCSSKCSEKYKTVYPINNFDEINSVNCYWYGFLFGDGSINHNGDIQVCLSNLDGGYNVKHLRKLSHLIYGFDRVHVYETKCHFRFKTNNSLNNLSRFGIIPNKTYNGEIIMPPKYQYDFIRGYFDADGWFSNNKYKSKNGYIYEKPMIGLCSFLSKNLEIISSFLPDAKITKKKKQELYEIRWQSQEKIKKFYTLVNGNLKLERKWDLKLDPYIKELENKKISRG